LCGPHIPFLGMIKKSYREWLSMITSSEGPEPESNVETTLIYVTKRYQLVRNITNIGDLHECQSFIVHAERRRLLRYQIVKKFLRPVLEFLFM